MKGIVTALFVSLFVFTGSALALYIDGKPRPYLQERSDQYNGYYWHPSSYGFGYSCCKTNRTVKQRHKTPGVKVQYGCQKNCQAY